MAQRTLTITVQPDWPDAPDPHKPDTAVTRCR